MPKAQICEEVGCTWSSLGRWARDEGVRVAYFNRWVSNPKLVREVCEYYSHHGINQTKERYPNVNVRSVIDRYNTFPRRQVRWSDDQIKELARMAGIISLTSQSQFFKRPNAHEGSIRSAWVKKFKIGGGAINGLSWSMARHFVTKECQPIRTEFWKPRKRDQSRSPLGRNVVLWVDLQKHLKEDVPPWLKESVDAMARFQVWLHGTPHVKLKIRQLIRNREKKGRKKDK